MTKYWDAGQVKTRLGATIGMERAAAIHRLFVSHVCASLAQVADKNIACLSPDQSLHRFRTELRSWGLEGSWDTLAQGEGSLGQRMKRWFIHCLSGPSSSPDSAPSPRAILIGADCPLLEAGQIRRAERLLSTHDVVLGPAADGGYYLIGLRGPWQSHQERFETLFQDIPWSTERVLSITRERLNNAGLSSAELDPREDVDTIVQLNRLRESLRADSIRTSSSRSANLQVEIERIMADTSLPTGSRSDDQKGVRMTSHPKLKDRRRTGPGK